MNTQQWTRARSDVRKRTTRSKGRTSTRVTGHGELSTLIGAREAHSDAGRVPMAIVDHALDNVRETAHGSDGDALARLADRWAQAIGAPIPPMIGNERNSWSEAGTMPTDPAILHSVAATTCGITGGIHPAVDSALAPAVTRKRKRATFPARMSAGTYVKRSGDPARRTITHGKRTIRPDVIHPNRKQGDKRAPYVWHDPVTETVRPRLKWTIHELPAIGHSLDHAFIGHGPCVERPPTEKQQREPRTVRDSVKVDASPVEAVQRTYEHAMKHEDPSGSWEWRAGDDTRGVLSISRKGRIGLSGNGLRVTGQRTLKGAIAALQAQAMNS